MIFRQISSKMMVLEQIIFVTCVIGVNSIETSRQMMHYNYDPYGQQYFHQQHNPYRYQYENNNINFYQRPNRYQYYQNQNQNQNGYGYRPYPVPVRPMRNTLTDVLHSVARNDDLQCVPRLICEMIADSEVVPNSLRLPFNLDMTSVVGLLSLVNGVNTSPVLHFSKAALLGVAGRKDRSSCYQNYPRCPQDPDKLVQYLNNYNGGFFRYFNGIYPQYNPQFYRNNININNKIERRIQNKPGLFYDDHNSLIDNRIRFNNDYSSNNVNYRVPNFIFPRQEREYNYNYNSQTFFPTETSGRCNPYQENCRTNRQLYPQNTIQDFKKLLTFNLGDRTGTGDLRFSEEELN